MARLHSQDACTEYYLYMVQRPNNQRFANPDPPTTHQLETVLDSWPTGDAVSASSIRTTSLTEPLVHWGPRQVTGLGHTGTKYRYCVSEASCTNSMPRILEIPEQRGHRLARDTWVWPAAAEITLNIMSSNFSPLFPGLTSDQ